MIFADWVSPSPKLLHVYWKLGLSLICCYLFLSIMGTSGANVPSEAYMQQWRESEDFCLGDHPPGAYLQCDAVGCTGGSWIWCWRLNERTRDVDTAGSFGQMSFCQVGIDSGHGKQAGNDLHTCTLYICGSWAPKKSKNGDTNAWIFEKNSCLHTGWGGVHKGMAHEKSFGNMPQAPSLCSRNSE